MTLALARAQLNDVFNSLGSVMTTLDGKSDKVNDVAAAAGAAEARKIESVDEYIYDDQDYDNDQDVDDSGRMEIFGNNEPETVNNLKEEIDEESKFEDEVPKMKEETKLEGETDKVKDDTPNLELESPKIEKVALKPDEEKLNESESIQGPLELEKNESSEMSESLLNAFGLHLPEPQRHEAHEKVNIDEDKPQFAESGTFEFGSLLPEESEKDKLEKNEDLHKEEIPSNTGDTQRVEVLESNDPMLNAFVSLHAAENELPLEDLSYEVFNESPALNLPAPNVPSNDFIADATRSDLTSAVTNVNSSLLVQLLQALLQLLLQVEQQFQYQRLVQSLQSPVIPQYYWNANQIFG